MPKLAPKRKRGTVKQRATRAKKNKKRAAKRTTRTKK